MLESLPTVLSLNLNCPKCASPLSVSPGNVTEIPCASCGFRIDFNGEAWDARTDSDSPMDFSRQWVLWDKNWLGSKDMLYGSSGEDNFQFILEVFGLSREQLPDKRILEIGFGNGRNLSCFQRFSNQAFGLDLVKPIKSYKLNPESMVCGSLFNPPFAPGQFDVVICQGVIHHTEDARSAFFKVVEQMAPGSLLFLYVYEKKIPRALKIRKWFPFSWAYPEFCLIGISHIMGALLALWKVIQEHSFGVFKKYHGNYTLGVFDTLSPRWAHTFEAQEILSLFQENSIEGDRISPCVYIGKRSP